MSLTPQASRLLSKEMVSLQNDPPEGVRIVVEEEDLTKLEGWVQGPGGTPYQGGFFRVLFHFGPEYPNVPPKCTMVTKIFHPNISKSGEICVDTSKKGWKKEYGVGHVLVTIKCLLIYPNPESASDEEAGKQLSADYEGYCKYAKSMTSIHATPKVPPPEFRETSSSSSKLTSVPPAMAHPAGVPQSSASTATPGITTTTRPGPLQAHAPQEQSPVFDPAATMGGDEKIVKPVSAVPTKPPAAKPKPAAKRGLKRL